MRRLPTLATGWLVLALIGCVRPATSAPAGRVHPSGGAPTRFDPQTLVGKWWGEWRGLDHNGVAYLEITEARDGRVRGHLLLRAYTGGFGSRSDREGEVEGSVAGREGMATLRLSGVVPPTELRVSGYTIEGTITSETVPSVTTLTLRRVR